MRRLVEACAVVACLAASGGCTETITTVDGRGGSVYSLRTVNDAPLPLYFSPIWYPGRGVSPNVVSITMLSADLTLRPDGTFTWSTLLEEVATRPGPSYLEYVVSTISRSTEGGWSHTEATGALSLQGIDPSGHYVLAGSMTSSVVALSTAFATGPKSTFVLER